MKRFLLCAVVITLALAAGSARAERPGCGPTRHDCSTSSHTSSCYDSDRCSHDRCSYDYCPPCNSDCYRSDCYSHDCYRPSCRPDCYSHRCYASDRFCSHEDRGNRR